MKSLADLFSKLCLCAFLVVKSCTFTEAVAPDARPVYPVTASWFRDRFSLKEWDEALGAFQNQGGDTVFLRAPPIIRRTTQDLDGDLNFIWCGSYKSSNPAWGLRCYNEAEQELKDMGLVVSTFVSYQYEENFSDDILLCPKLDKKINSSRIYYRIVLPGKNATYNSSSPCDYKPGSEVIVLLTSFGGTDPHQLLLQSAAKSNTSVYFGLPGVPNNFDADLMPAYYAWTQRVVHDHQERYSKLALDPNRRVVSHGPGRQSQGATLYNYLTGYYGTDECCLGDLTQDSQYLTLYQKLGTLVKSYGKKFAVSPYVDLNRSQMNRTVDQHVQGFADIAKTKVVDVIAIQEGRGAAKGCYYWPHQINEPVSLSDPVLDRAIRYLDPNLKQNITYAEAFSASNIELFSAFQEAQHALLTTGIKFDFWLNVEAFEFLRDDPCLPVDPMASGMGELLDRASKERLDRAISVAGARVQKIISFAWDADYTCTTQQYPTRLTDEILSDLQRPIIANCSFHSYQNLSVVLLGFNLEGETQAFTVEWTNTRGQNITSNIHGYYFELDYGIEHNLVESLEYTMLWDIPQMLQTLAPQGTIKVSAENARQSCYFSYDLPYRAE